MTRLKGKARKRFEHRVHIDGSVNFVNIAALFQAFEDAYDDSYKSQHAKRKLQRFYQGNRDFAV